MTKKLCPNCNQHIPNKIWIDGKQKYLTRRKFCLNCSPFGSKNSQALIKNSKGITYMCESCNREFVYTRAGGQTKNRCTGCASTLKRKQGRVRIYEYKGDSCLYCGYNRCKQNLHFHHFDSDDKLFSISGNENRAWDSLKKELDKCWLLCSICHTELHAGLIDKQELIEKERERYMGEK